MSRAAISVEGLTRTFEIAGKRAGWFRSGAHVLLEAVADLSFSIKTGEKVAFIGPNGAGKSTTIKMLCGLLRPTSGSAHVLGLVPWERTRELAKSIGLVFGQRSHLWPLLPVEDSFGLLAKIYDLDNHSFEKQREKLIKIFGLEKLLPQQAKSLSLGQRMRCDISAALLHCPKVLFLDEPTIGLDVAAKAMLRDHLNLMAEEFETTIILTSHDTDDIERICERVMLIDHGRKLLDTSIVELKREYTHYKTLRLVTEEEKPVYEKEGVSTLETFQHTIVLKVDVSKVRLEKVVAECLSSFKVQDISVEDLPLEEVIKNMYSRKWGKK